MNARRVGKVVVGLLVVEFGFIFAAALLAGGSGVGFVVTLLIALAIFIALLRKTPKDVEYAAKQAEKKRVARALREGEEVGVSRPVDQPAASEGGGFLMLNLVFGLIATPFVVLAKLLGLQK